MHDNAVPVSQVIATVLWAKMSLWFLATWAAALTQHWHAAEMCGFTTCVIGVLAGVGQVRCYTLRLVGLLRATAGLEVPDATVRSLRP